ncbi:MAG: ABC transporter permease [Flavobacteriaceae bacterium]|nr:ABC transporter permease [Flavobacteriaceae bacterium]
MFSLFRENVRIAVDSIKGQLLRTILTVLIIAIGITALVGILSGVKALENTISGDFVSMGANTFNIRQYELTVRRRGGGEREKVNPVISYRDAKDFKDTYDFPGADVSIFFTATGTAEVKFESQKTDPEIAVLGVDENFFKNAGLEVDNGRDFNTFDISNNNNVCVLGSDVVKALFENVNPVGKIISVRGMKFTVVGTLASKGGSFGNNQDLRVMIPIQLARTTFSVPNLNYSVSVNIPQKDLYDNAQGLAIQTFRNVRKLNPVEGNNFGIERSDDLLNTFLNITSALNIAAIIISLITIFGSSIALMNIMLVSVTERTREIGIRKSLGAKRRTIASQFFIETVIIGQLGGFFGIVLGLAVGIGFARVTDLDFAMPWGAMTWAIIVSFVVAVISGSFPAVKASKLDPIESLRYE